MIERVQRKINISYARFLKKRLADKYIGPDQSTRAEMHSVRVGKVKKIMIWVISVFMLFLVLWPIATKNWYGYKINFAVDKESDKKTEANSKKADTELVVNMPVMLDPEFYGHDENGQPFSLRAGNAVSVSKKNIVLSNISGEMKFEDGTNLTLSSDQGDYFIKNKEISLNGNVILEVDKGYTFKTNSSYIKIKENMATGSEPVEITGKIGDIEANGFNIRNSGDEILFFGGVKMVSHIDELEK